ncbi:MAG: phasin family protein [Thalassobaculaceae bacterium]
MANTNPFFEFDAQKLMADMKIPAFDTTAMVDFMQRNVEAVITANQTAFAGAQAVAKRQGEIVTKTMEESAKTVQDLMAASSPEGRVEKHATLLKDGYATAIANSKELSDIMTTSGGEALEIISKRVTDGLDEVTKMVATK